MRSFDYNNSDMEKLVSVFSEALSQIFEETGIKIIDIEDSELPSTRKNEVITSIGFTGKIKGTFILISTEKVAKKISDKMLSNMQISANPKKFGPMNRAAIGEIANQISGRAMTILSTNNIECDITPPTMLTGNNIRIINTDTGVYRSKMVKIEGGILYIVIGMKN